MNDKTKKWKTGLEKTRKTTFGRIANLLGATEIKDQTWDELEALLVQADLGIQLTTQIVEQLRVQAKDEGWTKAEQLKSAIKSILSSELATSKELTLAENGPTVILIVGVNGSGKTTSVAKLGKRFKDAGHAVLFGAADTFRAAAVEQLESWGSKLNIRVVAGQPDGDPGAVVYDAVSSGVARKADIVLIDTAGRLHTKFNLMEELKKVHRVAGKVLEGAPHEVWLVMDATTGQNAMSQAKAFNEAVGITGVILAKLDSSARGGMAFAIQSELGLPILFAGLGEQPEDLQPFEPEAFIDSLLADFG